MGRPPYISMANSILLIRSSIGGHQCWICGENNKAQDNNHYLAGYIVRNKPMKGVHDDICPDTILDYPWAPLVIMEIDLLCIYKNIYMDTGRRAK